MLLPNYIIYSYIKGGVYQTEGAHISKLIFRNEIDKSLRNRDTALLLDPNASFMC